MATEQVEQLLNSYFPLEVQKAIFQQSGNLDEVQEIRCRLERPIYLRMKQNREYKVMDRLTTAQMQHIISRISQGSVYAWEEEFRQGYLTLQGGHRVGLVGKGVLEHGTIRTLKQISGLNFRIARSVPGAADLLLDWMLEDGVVKNTLLVAPPGCGKTTLLRDCIRQLSNGIERLHFSGVNVGVVDERSELAGCVNGIPQLDVGYRTDVLDGCPKSVGIRMLIRSMGPQIVAADEIGTTADVVALEEAMQCGVHLVTTAHGNGIADVCRHPSLKYLMEQHSFDLVVSLRWMEGQIVLHQEVGECI